MFEPALEPEYVYKDKSRSYKKILRRRFKSKIDSSNLIVQYRDKETGLYECDLTRGLDFPIPASVSYYTLRKYYV